jgi:hypothetical protein
MAENTPIPEQIYALKELAPIAILILAYVLFMPNTGSPQFSTLETHQQFIALSAIPTIIFSLHRFVKRKEPKQ